MKLRLFATICALGALGIVALPVSAEAFCGFYVSDSNDGLYNDATRVSLLRHENDTVMSMQNNYAGPPRDFAMVVPVPVVLEKEAVKTLDDAVFERLDEYTAPRLVEYWERDPCRRSRYRSNSASATPVADESAGAANFGAKKKEVVTVEAEFAVGEYEIVVLSSEESSALESWLHEHDYNIPDGAAPYLEPYIQQGMYFFVARVQMDEVEYREGEAVLSPLRFHYQSDEFKLPVRLGLINSRGSQELIVYTLSPEHRFEVANYPNVEIPTNLRVDSSVRRNFGGFYTELFDRLMRENPNAVVTEYSWRTGSCDPCPTRPLDKRDLLTLGADVVAPTKTVYERSNEISLLEGRPPKGKQNSDDRPPKPVRIVDPNQWVVTRLHTKYDEETLGRDLVFTEAEPIRGGRGMPRGPDGSLPDGGARSSQRNNFQGRYVILNHWEGEVDCENPRRGIWGGRGSGTSRSAGDVGFAEQKPKPLSETVLESTIPGLERPTESYDDSAPSPSQRESTDDSRDTK